jgi:hypothetical protein
MNINNNIKNHFSMIRLQIGAETSLATKDIFIRHNQLINGFNRNIDRSLIRFSESSIAIQTFTTNYQKANTKLWLDTKNSLTNSEKSLLRASHITENCIYAVENKVDIIIQKTNIIEDLPKIGDIEDTLSPNSKK